MMLKKIIFFLVVFISLPLSGVGQSDENSPHILYYNLEDTIHGGTVEILNKIFSKAEKENFEAILIQLDTPGGLLDSTEDIVKLFLNAKIPVIVYVAPSGARAGSAGTFITLAAHVAAMAPGTYIGAAHPVMMFGGGEKEGEQQKIMKQKIESATKSFITAIAKQRGRNEEWAEKAVLNSESVTDDLALKKNVIDLVASTREALLSKIHGRKIKLFEGTKVLNTKKFVLVPYEPGLHLRFLNTLANPVLIYLLILGIIAGIYLEVSHPGAIFPGVGAGICLVLVLVATRTLPVNALGVLLIVGALALLVVEIYVTSYGLLTITAIACFFTGSLFLFDPIKTGVQVPLTYIIGSSAALAAIAVIIGYLVVKTFKRAQAAGKESLVGMRGLVEDSISPGAGGKVFINSEYWNAISEVEIEKGQSIEVVSAEGLNLTVRPVDK